MNWTLVRAIVLAAALLVGCALLGTWLSTHVFHYEQVPPRQSNTPPPPPPRAHRPSEWYEADD